MVAPVALWLLPPPCSMQAVSQCVEDSLALTGKLPHAAAVSGGAACCDIALEVCELELEGFGFDVLSAGLHLRGAHDKLGNQASKLFVVTR